MIFVTLGSQKFQFDRLLQAIDTMIDDGIVTDTVFAQTGASTYTPRNYEAIAFMDRNSFAETMEKATVVITHAGTGAIIGAVKKGKKVIAVPRLAKYGEHVDDHQIQIVNQFDELGILQPCYDTADLAQAYCTALGKDYTPYQSNTQTILDDISKYLEKLL